MKPKKTAKKKTAGKKKSAPARKKAAPAGKKPAPAPVLRGATRGAARSAGLRLSWEEDAHPVRQQWTQQLVAAVKQHKPQLDQGNPNAFISGYDRLSADDQIKFWCELFVAMSKFESSWNPADVFREDDGQDSIGLLQLSYRDQDNYRLTPRAQSQEDVKDALLNIQWGV